MVTQALTPVAIITLVATAAVTTAAQTAVITIITVIIIAAITTRVVATVATVAVASVHLKEVFLPALNMAPMSPVQTTAAPATIAHIADF